MKKFIVNQIKKGKHTLYHFNLKEGTSLVIIWTEELTTEQFKKFIMRHSNDMPLKVNKNRADYMSVFLHWCRYNEFALKSFQNLITSFEDKDYSILLTEYHKSNLLLEGKENRSLNYMSRWIHPSEQRSFKEFRVNLLKEQIISEIEKKIALV